MPARTRRERQPGRDRRIAEIRATGTRRRRLVERRAPDPGPRATWVFVLVVLVLGVGATMVILFGDVAPRTAGRPTPSPTAVASGEPPSPSPTSDLAVGDGRTPAPAATPSATRRPTRTAATADGLSVEFPEDGDSVVSARINAIGHAPGGARVLRDLPDGTTATSVARPDGLWFQRIDLAPGDNKLRFHLASGGETVVVHVTLQVR